MITVKHNMTFCELIRGRVLSRVHIPLSILWNINELYF